ncbi:MAG: hypothetical protein AAFP77_31165 [Bacteroidota bacterium]
MSSVISGLRQSKFLRPFIAAISLEQAYFLAVLMGLVNGIVDYSLFPLDQLPFLNVFIADASTIPPLHYWIGLGLLPLALLYIFRSRRPLLLLGLGPLIFQAALDIIGASVNTATTAMVLEVLYKLGFLFFIGLGRTRSLAFFSIMVLLLWTIPLSQVLIFLGFSLLGRLVYLFISQNIKTFRKIKAGDVGRLAFKSLLAWSPILLFAIPYYYFSGAVIDLVEETIYNETLVENYDLDSKLTFDGLMEQISTENYAHDSLRSAGLDTDQADEIQLTLLKALEVVKTETDSALLENDFRAPVERFHEVYPLFAKESAAPLTEEEVYLFRLVNFSVENIAINKALHGRNDFQLDVEISLYNFLDSTRQEGQRRLAEGDQFVASGVNQSIDRTEEEYLRFEGSLDSVANATQQDVNAYKQATDQLVGDYQSGLQNRNEEAVNSLHDKASQQISRIPERSLSAYDATFPPDLLSRRVKEADCGLLNVKCKAVNMCKRFIVRTYEDVQEEKRSQVQDRSEARRDALQTKADTLSENTKAQINADIETVAGEINKATEILGQTADATVENANEQIQTQARGLTDSVQGKFTQVREFSSAATQEAIDVVNEATQAVSDSITTTMWTIQRYLYFSKMFSIMSFIFLLISSYAYVFSRVAFADGNLLYVTLREGPKEFSNGIITQHGGQYSIPADHDKAFYIIRQLEPTGRAPKLVIPHWTTSIGRRIITGTYFMNEIAVLEDRHETVDFRSVQGAEFVEWDLSEGEKIVFDFRQLVAMEETVGIETHVSVRFSTLLLGRPFFYLATGPGKIVLMTRGMPITNDETELVRSMSLTRMVAWQKSTLFAVDSELNFIDLYMSGQYLRRSSDDLLIIDADPGKKRNKVGLFRFLISFLLPI